MVRPVLITMKRDGYFVSVTSWGQGAKFYAGIDVLEIVGNSIWRNCFTNLHVTVGIINSNGNSG